MLLNPVKSRLWGDGLQFMEEDAYDVIARYTNVLDHNEIAIENKLDGGKVNMCKAMRELMADERAEGRAEGSGDIVLEFLRELGALSEELIARIRQERDLQVLRAWAKLAARAGSVQEFEMEM